MRAKSLLLAALVLGSTAALADTRSFGPDNVSRVPTPAPADPGTWRQMLEFASYTQVGTLYTLVYDFGSGVEVDAIKAQLFQYVGERCLARITTIDVALDPGRYVLTRFRPDVNGEVALPDTRIYKVGFVFDQNVMGSGGDRCLLRFSGYTATGGGTQPPPPPPPDDDDDDRPPLPLPPEGFELAGVIPYAGGFRDQESVALWTSEKIDAFWARVPNFCSGLEILDAGILVDGQYTAWQRSDGVFRIYEVGGDQGIRADAVAMRLNGPASLRCDVPVYIRRSMIQ